MSARHDQAMPAVVRGARGPALVERPAPRPPPGWGRLRVKVAGVCRTDVAAARGLLRVDDGRVLGHELVGRVDVVDDDVDGALRGLRATVDPRLGEGRFLGLQDDGAFAGFVRVPVGALVAVPPALSARQAAFVEPVAAALAVRVAGLTVGARAGLTGGGLIAALTERVLAADGVVIVRAGDAAAPDLGGAATSLDAVEHTAACGLPSLSSLRRGARVVVKAPRAAGARRPARDHRARARARRRRLGSFADAVALLSSGARASTS
ncbi:MAG: hypothetical protein FJ137_04190 [Deltaproteobacteria bacterium]|nr:hypothetical protein [Deltaproteobacteria bacterium]